MVLLFACQKEDNTIQERTFPNFFSLKYMPLNVGNYWVYEHFFIDSMGNEKTENKFDSVVITRDSLIGDKKYYVLEGTNYPYMLSEEWGIVEILRDSLGYLVNQNGSIQLSQSNFTDTLATKYEVWQNDTMYSITAQMEIPDYPITVPAGTFEVINFKGTLYNYLYDTPKKDLRYINTYYAKNVGKIVHTWYYLSAPGNSYFEKRLVRYQINKEQTFYKLM